MSYSFRAYYPYYKRNLKLAFPVMLTQFGAALAIPAVLFHVRFHRQMKRLKFNGLDEID